MQHAFKCWLSHAEPCTTFNMADIKSPFPGSASVHVFPVVIVVVVAERPALFYLRVCVRSMRSTCCHREAKRRRHDDNGSLTLLYSCFSFTLRIVIVCVLCFSKSTFFCLRAHFVRCVPLLSSLCNCIIYCVHTRALRRRIPCHPSSPVHLLISERYSNEFNYSILVSTVMQIQTKNKTA